MRKAVIIIDLNFCKNSCIFCNPDYQKHPLNEKNIKKIETQLAKQIIDLRKQGFKSVEISGSDPLQYRKIVGLVRYLKKSGFSYVELLTHGRDLSDAKLVRRLVRAGLDELRIPLYGSNSFIHESVTQSRGSFNETLQGIQNVNKYSTEIKLSLTSLIMKQNYRDIVNICNLLSKYSKDIYFSIPCFYEIDIGRKVAVPFTEMKKHLFPLIDVSEERQISITFLDIPFCVFGFFRKNIKNLTGPPVTASTYKIPKQFRSDISNIPNYRLKVKPDVCRRCRLNKLCGGFYKKHIELFGKEFIKPL